MVRATFLSLNTGFIDLHLSGGNSLRAPVSLAILALGKPADGQSRTLVLSSFASDKKGLTTIRPVAVVYKGSDAVYGKEGKELERAQDLARTAKRGIWSQPNGFEKPAEYKRRTKGSDYSIARKAE